MTGLCNRSHCPLANSLYATIREDNGKVCLFIKTIERAHSPKNLWEKIELSRNYAKALEQVEEHLQFFPKAMQHRNKQRLTKIHQYLIRMRKLKLREMRGEKAKMVGINRKIDQREERREKKALVAAKVESSIEKELLERLAKGTYGDIYNFPEVPYQKALEAQEEIEDDEEVEYESESEEEGMVEYVEDFDDEESLDNDIEDIEYDHISGDDDEEEDNSEEESSASEDETSRDEASDSDDDQEELSSRKPKRPVAKNNRQNLVNKRRKGTRVEIEYEEEGEEPLQEVVAGSAW